MLRSILSTDGSFAPVLLRLSLAAVFLPHGLQKAFGWFGGYGPGPTIKYFNSIGVPTLLGAAVIAIELLGPFALAAGIGTRIAAMALAAILAVAALRVHAANGFFMNWFGNQKGEGIEFFIAAGAVAVALVVTGAGAWSLDRALGR